MIPNDPRARCHLRCNRPGEAPDERSVVVVATKSLPQIEAHIDGLLAAGVLIRDNSLAGNAVVCHGDDLGAQAVLLVGRAMGLEDS